MAAVDFYWLGIYDIEMNGEVDDFDGNFIDGGSGYGVEEWEHIFAGPLLHRQEACLLGLIAAMTWQLTI